MNGWLADERVALHLENRTLLLDGEVVTDLDHAAPTGTRLTIAG